MSAVPTSGAVPAPDPVPGHPAWRAVARVLAGGLCVALLAVGGVLARTVLTAHRQDAGPVDAIVVLGAAQYNGRPSPVYRERLDHAAALYRSGVSPMVITVGGGQPGDATTEGAAGREYLLQHGVPTAALLAVTSGRDTLASLRATAPLLSERGWTTVLLVTDPAHAYRATLMAQDLGWQVRISTVQTGPAVAGDVQVRYYTREVLGSLFYLLVGGSSNAGGTVL